MICPLATWRPVPSHSGPMSAHLGLVVHVQVGSGSCFAEFDIPANQASSTFWIGVDGRLEQYVDTEVMAWTEMAGNGLYDSVETEGQPANPLTARQADMLAALMAWGHHVLGWPLVLVDHGGTGVTTHAHYPSGAPDPAWGGHPCPGPVCAGQLPAIVAAAVALGPPILPLKEETMNAVFAPNGNLVIVGEATDNGDLMAFERSGTSWAVTDVTAAIHAEAPNDPRAYRIH